jgi:hypothetical protein
MTSTLSSEASSFSPSLQFVGAELRDGSLELLRIAFRALHAASGDLRPEVRQLL